MKKKKKLKRILLLLLLLGIVGGGAAGGVYYLKNHGGRTIDVVSVSDINGADWIGFGGEEGNSGMVVSNVTQNVRIPDDKVIDKVYVEEGDTVKIGDKLLSYDTTLLELDQELQELTVQELGLEIKSAEADLVKLKNTTPVAASSRDDVEDTGGSLLDSLRGDWRDSLDDSDDGDDNDLARLVTNNREMLASQEDDGQPESEPENSTEPATNPAQETTSGDPGEGARNLSADGEENLSDIPVTDGQEGGSEGGSGGAEDGSDKPEIILDPELSQKGTDGDSEVLDGNELGKLPAETGDADLSQAETEEGNSKKQKKLSLKKFLSNIRMKAVSGEGETLLADAAGGENPEVEITGTTKLIPHFREKADAHFEEGNTYLLLLQGVTLKQDYDGKIYGTAVVDGQDYPEIGGFTLIQSQDLNQTAQLTFAFHDGLTAQHKNKPELEDMYVELELSQEEILPGSLVFCLTDQAADNRTFTIINSAGNGQTPETEDGTDGDEVSDVDPGMTGDPALEQNGSDTEQENSEAVLTGEETESESETETESETDPENVPVEIPGQVRFRVIWNHGTNSEYNWPAALKFYVYQNSEDSDPAWVWDLMQTSSAPEGNQPGTDTGDSSIEEEDTTLSPEETAETGNPSDTQNQESETDSTEPEPTDPAEPIPDPSDPYLSTTVEWKPIVMDWPADKGVSLTDLNVQEQCWAYAENYLPSITLEGEDTIKITMTYQEPEESPLQVLNPIAELTYQHGVNTEKGTGLRAYRGSGTAEDPYIFFVTDGVVIRSGFVNWVLGFNEAGTERNHDGYYIRLEIRESDTITGAFIRSVDLDGTVMTETGYGPGTYWIFNSETGITRYEEEVPDPMDGPPGGDPGWSDNDGTYTAEELALAIEDKELEIKKLKLDEREAKLKLKKYNQDLEDCTVVSAVNGYVKSLGGDSEDVYMVVSSASGLYVKTTVNEMDLGNVSKDQVVGCRSWETGAEFTATVTQVDYFPASSNDSYGFYYGNENVNSSNYPVLAVVDDNETELTEYESVSVKFPTAKAAAGDIYLEKAYIRSENGQSYVMIADENGKLKKQYIRTGATVYGYVEVKQGLSTEDMIAFPYGKAAVEGSTVTYEVDDY